MEPRNKGRQKPEKQDRPVESSDPERVWAQAGPASLSIPTRKKALIALEKLRACGIYRI